MKATLSDTAKRAALKKRILQYPGMTEEEAERLLKAYEGRVERKEEFLGQGFNNASAEASLDRLGYPRPPGWYSVFFYPDGIRPRNLYVLLLLVIAVAALWYLS